MGVNLKLIILGTRGIPAHHGGFETFAENLSLYLVKKNWDVTIYCQESGTDKTHETKWKGITRVHIHVGHSGPLGTVIFDFKSILHSLRFSGVFLTLGYNTAIFNCLYRLKKKPNIINMDGLEWKRKKWNSFAKAWLLLNEYAGCWLGNHLIADNPHIAKHLETRVAEEKITTIPYGAREILAADEDILKIYGLKKNNYAILIARAEPENSILEIVTAFSSLKRNANLVVMGDFKPISNAYHKEVIDAASSEVLFPGAIYQPETIGALRFFARFYVHGHQVGGTNPSLVEALGAGNAVLAYDNNFNRWVANDAAIYFNDIKSAESAFTLLFNEQKQLATLKTSAIKNFREHFQWETILFQYEQLLLRWL